MKGLYHFRCPRCGATDEHVGPAREKETICGICNTAAGMIVVLERRRLSDCSPLPRASDM